MKPHLCLLILLLSAGSASAESWIFRPSYYTHDPVSSVRLGRQYSTGPVFTRPRGESVTVGWRWSNNRIQVGPVSDQYNVWESFIEGREKF